MAKASNIPDRPAELKSISWLHPHPRNARTHTEEQINQIVSLVERFGWTAPIVADETGVILSGHGRRLAALQMGLQRVPTVIVEGWTDEEKLAYMLADNQVALNAGWDVEELKVQLEELIDFDLDLSSLNFEIDDVETGFEPNLNPVTGGINVTDDDVEAARGRLEGRFKQERQEIVDVVCPHCGEKFGLNRSDVK